MVLNKLKIKTSVLFYCFAPLASIVMSNFCGSALSIEQEKEFSNISQIHDDKELYPNLNYNYHNTFTASSYEAIKSEELRQYFEYFIPRSNKSGNSDNKYIEVLSDSVFINGNNQEAIYTGNILVTQADREIKAKKIIYSNKDKTLSFVHDDLIQELQNNKVAQEINKIQGKSVEAIDKLDLNKKPTLSSPDINFSLKSEALLLEGDSLTFKLDNKEYTANNSEFALVDTIVHGKSDKATVKGKKIYLTNSTIYAGPIYPLTLNIKSDGMVYDLEKSKLSFIGGTTFRIGRVPILYVPKYSLNLKKDYKYPFRVKAPLFTLNSTNGFLLSLPIEWFYNSIYGSIGGAFFPSLSARKGIFFNSYTYLNTILGNSSFYYYLVPSFNILNKEKKNRYQFQLKHSKSFNNSTTLNINFNKQSHKTFAQEYLNSSSLYLQSDISLNYDKDNIISSLRTYGFEPINDNSTYSYDSKPELNFKYIEPFVYSKPYYSIENQYIKFINNNGEFLESQRFYTIPKASYSILNKYFRNTTSIASYFIGYKQISKDRKVVSNARVLPEFKTFFDTTLIRDNKNLSAYRIQERFAIGYTYRDVIYQQKEGYNAVYDSNFLSDYVFSLESNYNELNVDRIGFKNQVNLQYNFSAIDKISGKQKVNTSLGILKSFSHPFFSINSKNRYKYKSIQDTQQFYTKSSINFLDSYNLDISSKIDMTNINSSMANISLNYQPSLTNIIQLSYRYLSKSYIKDNLLNNQGKSLKQVGLSTIWDATKTTSVLASSFFDLKTGSLLDLNIAIRYVYFGWALGARFERVKRDLTKYDNKFNLELKFYGFSDDYNNDFGRYINSGKIQFVGNH